MADALSDRTIDIVKATVPALEKAGTAVTDRMNQILFGSSEIRDLFNQSHHSETGSQSKALTAAVGECQKPGAAACLWLADRHRLRCPRLVLARPRLQPHRCSYRGQAATCSGRVASGARQR